MKDFSRAGGTHLLVVNKPSWHLGDLPESGVDFEHIFETTLGVVEESTKILDGRAWPVLGVHPGLISQLTEAGHTPADASEIMRWLSGFTTPPAMTYLVHGEPGALAVLKAKIEEEKQWPVHIAGYQERVPLSS